MSEPAPAPAPAPAVIAVLPVCHCRVCLDAFVPAKLGQSRCLACIQEAPHGGFTR